MAQYSGNDPHQGSTVFLDRAFGMGSSTKELLKGYDCPADAQYLSMTVHEAQGSSTRLDAVCVFERDSGKPLSRHTGWLSNEMGVRRPLVVPSVDERLTFTRFELQAVKGYELVIRSISTVGNYVSLCARACV